MTRPGKPDPRRRWNNKRPRHTFSAMALCEFRFFSKVLGKQVGAYVLMPDRGKPPFATLYLLHGLSDDYTTWLRRSRIEYYVRDLPLAVVMPDGFRGAYTDNAAGPAYARYMIEDVVGGAERHFRLRADRSARAVGGLSMGGYGALRLGLRFPDVFSSVHSHSGALLWGARASDSAEFTRVFGESPAGTDHDLLALAERCKANAALPEILIDCGVDDFLFNDNETFVAALKDRGVPHTYRTFPGAHDWDYWDEHVRDAVAFHGRNLNLAKP
jgi:S-formylglutathione hydrolase FrmB